MLVGNLEGCDTFLNGFGIAQRSDLFDAKPDLVGTLILLRTFVFELFLHFVTDEGNLGSQFLRRLSVRILLAASAARPERAATLASRRPTFLSLTWPTEVMAREKEPQQWAE